MRNMKPHRKIFRLAPDQGGGAADRNPLVGDRMDNYVKGRSRVGMKTDLVSRNGQRPRGRYQPDHTIRNHMEITGILGALPPYDASGPCC